MVAVNVISPHASSSVNSTFSVSAQADSTQTIAGWEVDVDGVSVYTGPAAANLSTNLTTTLGTHQLSVKAWNSAGVSGSQTLEVVVTAPPTSGGGSLPTPPADALVFGNIQEMRSGWGFCDSAACAGGRGNGTAWQALGQSSPSLSGSSMELYRDGVYSNALWWHKFGADNRATNLLWDFYVQLDQASLTNGQALEYDAFQFVDGYNYMVGSQCDYGAGVWDIYDKAGAHWVHTTIACKKFAPDTWHHIQWYMTTDHTAHTYTYVTLVVDGESYSVNQTEGAKSDGSGDNVGVQWQLDVNSSGGGYHQWVDQASFTVW
jgi:hypothetical protein